MVQPDKLLYLARAEGSDSASARSRPSTEARGSPAANGIGLHRFARIAPVGSVAFQDGYVCSRLIHRGGSTTWATNPPDRDGRPECQWRSSSLTHDRLPKLVIRASKTDRPFAPAAAISSKMIVEACSAITQQRRARRGQYPKLRIRRHMADADIRRTVAPAEIINAFQKTPRG